MLKKIAGVLLFIFCIIFALSVILGLFHSFLVENTQAKNDISYNYGVIVGKIIANLIFVYLLFRLTRLSLKLIMYKKPVKSEIDNIGQQE